MPEGILLHYNDGRPDMVITAGLRAPSFCTNFSGYGTEANKFIVNTTLNTGSTLIVVPTKPIDVRTVIDMQTEVIVPVYMTGVTRSGNTSVTISGRDPYGYNLTPNWSGAILEVLSASSTNEGLYLENSTDFTVISNRASLMTCAYSGVVTVNGSMALPVSGIPFGKWNNANVSVGFDGANIIVRDIAYTGRDDLAGSATIELAIFNQTPPVGGDGITMLNPAGQVTFSTIKRPFIDGGSITLSNSNQSIGDKFCQIVYTGANNRAIGGYDNVRYKGVVMSGGYVRSERNRVVGNYYNGGWNINFDYNIAMPVLTIPYMY